MTAKTTSLHSAMAAAFGEIEGATKSVTGQVGQQKYKYADIASVIGAIKPALIKHGLFFTQHPHPSEDGVTVETILHHSSGESFSLGSLFVPANKRDAQGFGSALTYARRYGLVTAFGVPVEDDDGNAAVKGQREGKVSPPPANGEMPDAEWARLVQLLEVTKADGKAMLAYFKVADLRKLNQDQYAEAINILNAKLAKAAKAETNAIAEDTIKSGIDLDGDSIPY